MSDFYTATIKGADALKTDRDLFLGLTTRHTVVLPDNIVLFTRKRLRPQDYAGTVHHRYVLAVFLQTPGTVFIQRHRVGVREKEAVLIRPFEQHYYALPGRGVTWLFITFELPSDQPLFSTPRVTPVTEAAMRTLDLLLQAYRKKQADRCRLLLGLFLSDINLRKPGTTPAPVIEAAGEAIAEAVNRYIHDHVNRPFTLHELARHCGVSSSHLRFTFRTTVGISLGRYIRRIRMDRAAHLLLTTRLTVSEIAYACGFSSPAVFCRAFRMNTRHAPGAFRTSKSGRTPAGLSHTPHPALRPYCGATDAVPESNIATSESGPDG